MKLVDTEETIVLVTGSSPAAEERDRPLAYRLKAEIDRRGAGHAYRRAVVVADLWYLQNRTFQLNPTVAIGGPGEDVHHGAVGDAGVARGRTAARGNPVSRFWGRSAQTVAGGPAAGTAAASGRAGGRTPPVPSGSNCEWGQFEFALDVLLSSFEQLHQQGWSAPAIASAITRGHSSSASPSTTASACASERSAGGCDRAILWGTGG